MVRLLSDATYMFLAHCCTAQASCHVYCTNIMSCLGLPTSPDCVTRPRPRRTRNSNHKPSALGPQAGPWTSDPRPQARDPRTWTLRSRPKTLNPGP
eukprot:857225-Rhodomonas_salina.15